MNDFHSTAFFVKHPFRIEDLKVPHRYETRKRFVVVKTIELSKIDYDNFVADLCVDRIFIEKIKGFVMLMRMECGVACWLSSGDGLMECW